VTDWKALRAAAETYADALQLRITVEHRYARANVHDEDPAVPLLAHIRMTVQLAEDALRDVYRREAPAHIRAWQAGRHAVGDLAFARLLGQLGDPRTATPMHWEGKGRGKRVLVADEPFERSISQLWSYCGVGDHKRKRRREGMSVEDALACGSPALRAALFRIGGDCNQATGVPAVVREPEDTDASHDEHKATVREMHEQGLSLDEIAASVGRRLLPRKRSPYRAVYDARRAVTADRVHDERCARCGKRGQPAEPGTPWKDAHKHADALRIVAKEILRDLWLVADEGANAGSGPNRHAPLPVTDQGGEPAEGQAEPTDDSPAAAPVEEVA
jgi:hypothetical protein